MQIPKRYIFLQIAKKDPFAKEGTFLSISKKRYLFLLLLAVSMEIAENGLVITLRRKSVEWETILTFSVLAFLKHRQDT